MPLLVPTLMHVVDAASCREWLLHYFVRAADGSLTEAFSISFRASSDFVECNESNEHDKQVTCVHGVNCPTQAMFSLSELPFVVMIEA